MECDGMLVRRLFDWSLRRSNPWTPKHSFSALTAHHEKPLPPRIVVNENEITESFLKGTGPGGQKINKTSSAVQLKHLPTGIVVKCQDTRSREQNRKTARRLLGERLEEREKGDQARTVIKAEKASKKKASAEKKRRRKYRRLEEERAAAADGGAEGGGHDGEDGVADQNAVERHMERDAPQRGAHEHGAPP